MSSWSPDSWKSHAVAQDVDYPEPEKLVKATEKLSKLPPIVTPREICALRDRLRDAALGRSFVLQGGDCAELFEYCSQAPIENKLKVLLQMSLVLIWGARMPVVRIARLAGQYAKPRSKPMETLPNGRVVHAFRGDNINGYELEDRTPDPERLVQAYFHSAATLNYVRGILHSGFADLHRSAQWNLDHVRSTPLLRDYQHITQRLTDALDFMSVIGAGAENERTIQEVEWYTSHEALSLPYETSLTRHMDDPRREGSKAWFNTSAHMVWIGDRTRQLDGAHLEYAKGVVNPVGVKVGPSMKPDELIDVLNKLNPEKEIGKVVLITRFGHGKIQEYLPGMIRAVKESGHTVVWLCDPMHGNTETTADGVKTRNFKNIIGELSSAFRIHKACGSALNGVHFELTGDSVTECVGGSMELGHEELSRNYQTYCDPRLNYEQSLDMAFLIAKYCEKERQGQFEI